MNPQPHRSHRLQSLIRTSLLLGLTAALAVGCAAQRPSPTEGGQGTPRTGAELPQIAPLPAGSFARSWVADLGLASSGKAREAKDSVAELHLRDEIVFVYTARHMAYGLNRKSGQVMFINTVCPPQTTLRPPVLLPERVVYPTHTTFEVYNRRGKFVKSVKLDYALRSNAVGAGNSLYVGIDHPGSGRLMAVDLSRAYSVRKWELMTMGPVSATPAIQAGVLYIGAEDGHLYATNEGRAAVWPLERGVFVTDGRIVADVKADDYGVYVASSDSKLYCLDRATGKIKWQYFAGQPLAESPVPIGDLLLQYIEGTGMVALDKTTGKYNRTPRWTRADARQVLAGDDKHLYLRMADNAITAVDRKTGQEKFRSKRRDFVAVTMNPKDAVIYAATADGQVMAITPVLKSGTVGELVLSEEGVRGQG